MKSLLNSYINSLCIAKKIQLIFFPPAIMLGVLVLLFIVNCVQSIGTAKETLSVIEYTEILDQVAHNTARERGLTAGFLGSGATKPNAKLVEQRKNTDVALTHFFEATDRNGWLNDAEKSKVTGIREQLQNLNDTRRKIDSRSRDANAFVFYSGVNKEVLDTITLFSVGIKKPDTMHNVSALNSVLWLKERAGQERGAINGALSRASVSTDTLMNIVTYVRDQENQIDRLNQLLDEHQKEALTQALRGTNSDAVTSIRSQFLTNATKGNAISGDPERWFSVATKRIVDINGFAKNLASTIVKQSRADLRSAWWLLGLALSVSLIGGAILTVFSRTISRQLQSSLRALISSLNRLRDEKLFSVRAPVASRDEIGQASQAFNDLMTQLQAAVDDVNGVMVSVAKGEFSARVTNEYEGDLEHLKDAVNHSASKVDTTMIALAEVMTALESGNFSARMSGEVEGQFKQQVDGAMAAVENAIGEVSTVMASMSAGDFSARIEAPMVGSFSRLKDSVNSSLEGVESAIADLAHTLDGLAKGDFSSRMDGPHTGQLQRLQNNVNESMETLDGAMHELNDIFDAVQAGDFGQRITRPLLGDLDQMKTSINSSLDSLDAAINEIVQVANDHKNGKLDRRIIGSHQGELQKLTNALNSSSEELSATIGIVGQVMSAVQNGDFSARITAPMAGDFRQLGDAVNQSVSALEGAIREIVRLCESQEKGNLETRIEGDFRGQLGKISESLNATTGHLASVIRDVQQASYESMSASQKQSHDAFELSRRTEAQAASLEQIASTMEEINALVSNTERDCGSMAEFMASIQEATEESRQTVNDTVSAMVEMRDSSKQIVSITGMIDEIAFQTNLLALNAAVEAARAGEQGRGFAVVAGEVRHLAQRSADAAKNIKSLIEQNLNNVESSYDLTQRATASLESIRERVGTAFELTQNVNNAANEQATGIREANHAIASLDSATQENAAMVSGSTAAAKKNLEEFSVVNEKLAFFQTGAG